jgi:hypothetical protein
MSEATALEILVVATAAVFVTLYVMSSTTWEFDDRYLELRWLLFARIPFRRRRVPLSDIAGVERYGFIEHWKMPVEFYGRNWPSAGRRVIVRLRSGWIRGVVFVPSDADEFNRELVNRLAGSRPVSRDPMVR